MTIPSVSGTLALESAPRRSLHGHVNVITVLADAGGRTGTVLTTNGATDLWTACWQGHVDVVQYLLTRPNVEIDRARSDQRDAEDRDAPFAGTTPLEVTIVAGHDGIADLLRQHGATASAFPDDALRSFYVGEEEEDSFHGARSVGFGEHFSLAESLGTLERLCVRGRGSKMDPNNMRIRDANSTAYGSGVQRAW